MAAARMPEDEYDAPTDAAEPKPATAVPKPKPAKAAAAAPRPAAVPAATAAKTKKAKDVCEVSDGNDCKELDGGSDDVGTGAAADVTPRAARVPRRATAAAPVAYIDIADSDKEEEEDALDSGSEFNGEE
ncbi:hypothetical protein FOA52_014313 [Chlamydomonas sp. UWO 241]|nr:hypothetical protein FOA52_014313 [Chlamydomonas sp. UWO 241]